MGLPYTLEPYVQYVHINSFGNQGTTQLIVPDVFIVVGIPSMVFNNPIDIFVMNDVSRSKKMHMLSYIPCTVLGMPKSRDLYNHLLPGFSGNFNPGIFWSRDN